MAQSGLAGGRGNSWATTMVIYQKVGRGMGRLENYSTTTLAHETVPKISLNDHPSRNFSIILDDDEEEMPQQPVTISPRPPTEVHLRLFYLLRTLLIECPGRAKEFR